MSMVTALWSAVAAASCTMALVYGFAWTAQQRVWANLSFAIFALGVAGYALCELLLMKSQTTAQFATVARWIHVPVWVVFLSLVAFIRLYLRAGRLWLGLAACGLRTLVLVVDFVQSPNLNFTRIDGLKQASFLGEAVSMPIGVPSPWMIVAQASLVLLILFILDASVATWRRGEHRRAVTVGGGLLLFFGAATLVAVLSLWSLAPIPLVSTPFFLGIVGAMGFDLGRDMLHAARLTEELKVKDAALRLSEARLSLAAQAANAGLWTIEPSTGHVWATREALRMVDLDGEREVDLERIVAAVHPEDRPGVRRKVGEALATGELLTLEFRVPDSDGGYRWLSSTGRVYRSGDGTADLMGVTLDVTQRRTMEEEAARARAERAELARTATLSLLAGALAHEINQPLATILSNAEAAERLLVRDPPALDEVGEIVGDIAREVQRAADAIRRLRELVGRGIPPSRALDLNGCIERAAALGAPELRQRGVALTLELSPGLPQVFGDPLTLEQIFHHLVSNASDALGARPAGERRIRIATECARGRVLAVVADSGPGLGEDAERVFDAFYTTKSQGLGLGLAISRSIAIVHGGRLWAEENPQDGATFCLELPVAGEGA